MESVGDSELADLFITLIVLVCLHPVSVGADVRVAIWAVVVSILTTIHTVRHTGAWEESERGRED